ncbi:MAG TPA: acyltransferase family protein [Acidimicrobiia bacterium]|nr:acyltransferase family protein [Acidimicrobiia bacterium]
MLSARIDPTPTPVQAATGTSRSRQRGLDGLRGIALIAMLLYHQGFDWARGGYLAVSLFFTLSGFLIARLLIKEVEGTGGLRLGSFWGRRIRRLAPAALLALLLICLYGAYFATESQRLSMRGDIWASLAEVTNWRFVAAGNPYAALYQDPSPVQHFWTLAVEEQFYLVFPLIAAGVAAVSVRWGRATWGIRRSLGTVVVALMVASVAAQLLLHSVQREYYGTDTRAMELLAGVLLACCWTPRLAQSRTAARAASVTGVVALVAIIVLWATVGFGTEWIFNGGLLLVALTSVVVIIAATVPGPVRTIGSWKPLVVIGLISYGLYLYHWPVFLALNTARTGLEGWPLFALRCAVTGVLAVGSYYLLELPFREGAIGRVRVAPMMWVAGLVAVAVAVPVIVPLSDPTKAITPETFKAAEALVASQRSDRAHPQSASGAVKSSTAPSSDAPVAGTVADPPRPLNVYVVGDSTGQMFAGGLAMYGKRTGALEVRSGAIGACPIGMGRIDRFKVYNGGYRDLPVPPECVDAPHLWASDLAAWRPDMIIVVGGPGNSSEFHRTGDPDDRTLLPTDPAGRAEIAACVADVARYLREDAPGVPQLWLTSPYIFRLQTESGETVEPGGPQNTVFMDVYNQTIARLAATTPWVTTVPWADAVNATPPSEDATKRPDGIHMQTPFIDEMLTKWFPIFVRTRDSVVAKESATAVTAEPQWARNDADLAAGR